jgi:hypothetical protein
LLSRAHVLDRGEVEAGLARRRERLGGWSRIRQIRRTLASPSGQVCPIMQRSGPRSCKAARHQPGRSSRQGESHDDGRLMVEPGWMTLTIHPRDDAQFYRSASLAAARAIGCWPRCSCRRSSSVAGCVIGCSGTARHRAPQGGFTGQRTGARQTVPGPGYCEVPGIRPPAGPPLLPPGHRVRALP